MARVADGAPFVESFWKTSQQMHCWVAQLQQHVVPSSILRLHIKYILSNTIIFFYQRNSLSWSTGRSPQAGVCLPGRGAKPIVHGTAVVDKSSNDSAVGSHHTSRPDLVHEGACIINVFILKCQVQHGGSRHKSVQCESAPTTTF